MALWNDNLNDSAMNRTVPTLQLRSVIYMDSFHRICYKSHWNPTNNKLIDSQWPLWIQVCWGNAGCPAQVHAYSMTKNNSHIIVKLHLWPYANFFISITDILKSTVQLQSYTNYKATPTYDLSVSIHPMNQHWESMIMAYIPVKLFTW